MIVVSSNDYSYIIPEKLDLYYRSTYDTAMIVQKTKMQTFAYRKSYNGLHDRLEHI